MSKRIKVGAATAYGIAKAHGYTGTEAEWIAEQQKFHDESEANAEAAEKAAAAAADSQSAAGTSANRAATSEANASASATTASNKATAAEASATAAAASASAAATAADTAEAARSNARVAQTAAEDAQAAAETAQAAAEAAKDESFEIRDSVRVDGINLRQGIREESATQQAAIAAKGAETLGTIPDDYTTLANTVGELSDEIVPINEELLPCNFFLDDDSVLLNVNHGTYTFARKNPVAGNTTVIIKGIDTPGSPELHIRSVQYNNTEYFQIWCNTLNSSSSVIRRIALTGDDYIKLTVKEVACKFYVRTLVSNTFDDYPTVKLNLLVSKRYALSKLNLDDVPFKASTASLYETNIPSYWMEDADEMTNYLPDRLASINAMKLPKILFYTDIHYRSNAHHSDDIAAWIDARCGCDWIVNGGDVFTQYEYKEEAEYIYKKQLNAMFGRHGSKCKYVFGNHDINMANRSKYPDIDRSLMRIPYETIYLHGILPMIGNTYESLTISAGSETWYREQLHYYWDDAQHKIRYIVLDSGSSGDMLSNGGTPDRLNYQRDWLASVLQGMSDGWSCVVFTHMMYARDSDDKTVITMSEAGSNITAILDDAQNHTNNSGYMETACGDITVICVISGHIHGDYTTIDNNILNIVTSTDGVTAASVTGSTPEMTEGTTTEQCLDVFSFDTINRKIYVTRIGAGDDREFSY